MFITKKGLKNLVIVETINLQKIIKQLEGEVIALKTHTQYLNNHVTRHSNCRKNAEEQLTRIYETALNATKEMVGQSSAKELIAAALKGKK